MRIPFPRRRIGARRRTLAAVAATCLLTLAGAACTSTDSSSGSGNSFTVGFVMVGSSQDYGYNQAVYEGSQAVKKDPHVNVLTADEIPESQQAQQAMEDMIAKGAKVIFSTSYGYLQYAERVAAAHPDVVVVQQGNFITGTVPPNMGTYWGHPYDGFYLSGIAAGLTTKSNKLGFVYAFPIPQVLDNINAFELGAKSVNPQAVTYTVSTSNWCDPAAETQAANSLINSGVDVITQHQDCPGAIISAAATHNVDSVGIHANAQALNPKGWVTGTQWNWAPMYEAIVAKAQSGTFKGSQFNANYVASFTDPLNPVQLSPFGAVVPADAQQKVTAVEKNIETGVSPFSGPLSDSTGKLEIPAGTTLPYERINQINWLVTGVVGKVSS